MERLNARFLPSVLRAGHDHSTTHPQARAA
jgi:hypothetical protein